MSSCVREREFTELSDHSQITVYLKRKENANIHSQHSKLYNIREKITDGSKIVLKNT